MHLPPPKIGQQVVDDNSDEIRKLIASSFWTRVAIRVIPIIITAVMIGTTIIIATNLFKEYQTVFGSSYTFRNILGLFAEERQAAAQRSFVVQFLFNGYGLIFILPLLVTLPLVLPYVLFWKTPGHFLLLRPFSKKWNRGIVKRLMRRNVAPYGHIYTLSDSKIKIPWYIQIPIILGQLSLFLFRFRTIYRPEQLEKLELAIRRRWLRNLNWSLSYMKIFPVTCMDFSWKACVSRLLSDMDVIIIDLSETKTGVIWELDRCKELGVLDKVLFVKRENPKADSILQELEVNLKASSGIFIYDKAGLQRADVFQATIRSILAQRKRNSKNTSKSCTSVIGYFILSVTYTFGIFWIILQTLLSFVLYGNWIYRIWLYLWEVSSLSVPGP